MLYSKSLLVNYFIFLNTERKEGREEEREGGKTRQATCPVLVPKMCDILKKISKVPAPQKSLIIFLEYFLFPSLP